MLRIQKFKFGLLSKENLVFRKFLRCNEKNEFLNFENNGLSEVQNFK